MTNEMYYAAINEAILEVIDDNDPEQNVERATIIAHIIEHALQNDTGLYRQLAEYIEPAIDLAGAMRNRQ